MWLAINIILLEDVPPRHFDYLNFYEDCMCSLVRLVLVSRWIYIKLNKPRFIYPNLT